jgi:N-acetylmuramoyl-L-alanine amidase
LFFVALRHVANCGVYGGLFAREPIVDKRRGARARVGMFEIENGRLMIDGKPAAFVATPNQGGRLDPTLIVLHDTAGRLAKGSSVAWFSDPKAKASAHVVVERDGSVTQVVSFDRVAWHAGLSSWRGRSNCNAFAIGIEIVNPGKLTGTPASAKAWFGESFGPESGVVRASTPAHGDGCWMPYTEAQLRTVEQLIAALGREYPIGEVVAHHDISPGRKVDTTPLMDWPRMRAVLESGGAPHDEVSRTQATPADATPPTVSAQLPPAAASPARSPAWKMPLAFAAGAVILWALVTGKINNDDAQKLFKELVP